MKLGVGCIWGKIVGKYYGDVFYGEKYVLRDCWYILECYSERYVVFEFF